MTEPSAYRCEFWSDVAEYSDTYLGCEPPSEVFEEGEYRNVEPLYAESDLRELIEEWRENNNPAETSVATITNECAEELEELIDG